MPDEPESENSEANAGDEPDRRKFIKGASCAIGAAIGVVPMVAGVRVALNPLSEKSEGGETDFLKLAELSELELGVPKKYSIVSDKKDKWTRQRDVPIGAVYLLKTANKSEKQENSSDENATSDANATETAKTAGKGERESVVAFNTVCPHLGCFIDYRSTEQDFFCPCHDSKFALDGSVEGGVSPRGMDELELEVRNATEVWVKYQRFKANTATKEVIQ